MREIKCPKCQSVFQVDDADYASIVNQVKNVEFQAEIERRTAELTKQLKAEQKVNVLQSEKAYKEELSAKEIEIGKKYAEIDQLKGKLETLAQNQKLELGIELSKKEKEIQELKSQIDPLVSTKN